VVAKAADAGVETAAAAATAKEEEEDAGDGVSAAGVGAVDTSARSLGLVLTVVWARSKMMNSF
jgi:hypothetical protein